MTKINQVYRCNVCGNIIEVLHEGADSLVCCGQKMELLKENSTDGAVEKHVPVIEKSGDKIVVKVGSSPHPMLEEHFIEWIEVLFDGRALRQYLKPGDKPEAVFNIKSDKISARAYCNLHGLWVSE